MIDFHENKSGAVWLSDLELIVETESHVQKIAYYYSRDFGRVLIIDGEIQHVEAWAPFYHEILVHLPCSFIENPKNVLIVGGGSLFAAEEILKYSSINRVTMVDHDLSVVDLTVAAYPNRKHVLDDVRLNIIQMTYQDYIPSCQDRYDLIINDCFDLYRITKMTKIDYYSMIASLLTSEGVVSDLVYRSIYDEGTTRDAIYEIPNNLNKALSMLAVPEYPGTMHILTMWGRNRNLDQKRNEVTNKYQEILFRTGIFQMYNPLFMSFYLYLPPYIRRFLDKIS